MAARTVKLVGGREIEADGDVIPVLEALYQGVAAASGFEHTFLDMRREIEALVSQLSPKELRTYFMNSLFLNVVTYENQMAERILRNITRTKAAQQALRPRPAGRRRVRSSS
ncbi:MAG: hypothetical protein U0166_17285 [Acidobacteriota bacterium]